MKLPHIRILFILYFAERDRDIAVSRVVKICGVNRVDYVDELYKMGLVKLYHKVELKRRITAYVTISKNGLNFMTKILDLVTKHELWDYIRVSLHNGLIILDDESTRLIHALSLLILRDGRILNTTRVKITEETSSSSSSYTLN